MRAVAKKVAALRLEPACALERPLLRHRPERLRHAHGRTRDHLGVPLVGLRVAREQRRRPAGGDAGQVGDLDAGGPRAPHDRRADVAALVDHGERPAVGRGLGEHAVDRGLVVGHPDVEGDRAPRQDAAGPVRELAHVEAHVGVVRSLE